MSTNYPHTTVILETSTAAFLYCKDLQNKCKVCGGICDAASWRFCRWDGHTAYHTVYINYFHSKIGMCQESSEGWYPHRELQDIVGFLGFVKVDRMVFPSGVISGDQGEIWWPQTPRAVRCHSDDDDDEEL